MSSTNLPLPQARRFGETSRRDRWWLQPLAVFLGLSAFVVYSTWRAFAGAHFEFESLLSPFYSPLMFTPDGARSHHAWFSSETFRWFPLSPALLILWAPGGFRFTCYYYRGAYYKAFWGDPMSCSVGEPRKSYLGENSLPLILQNLHRFMMYFAVLFIGVLIFDFCKSCFWGEPDSRTFGLHLGSVVMGLNVVFLGGYTLGCHSLRHIVGGGLDILSRRPVRKKAYDCVTCLNGHHMRWAWVSLFWVGFTDFFVMMCSLGKWDHLWIIHP